MTLSFELYHHEEFVISLTKTLFIMSILKKTFLALPLAALLIASSGCNPNQPASIEKITVTADRASGSLTFIDASTNQVVETLVIPNSEPMYVLYVEQNDMIYVGDRAQNLVHMVDGATRGVVGSISVGNGVFHMWADENGNQLWVNNDIDNTTSVIDLSSHAVVATIPLSVKPHDVFVRANGSKAYISAFSGDPSTPDSIFVYSTTNFQRLNAAAVGKDPHLFHIKKRNRLFVPCQSGEVYVLNGANLNLVNTVAAPGAHGIFSSETDDLVYVTNISGAQLYAMDNADASIIGTPTSTPLNIPHNVTVGNSGTSLYVSHSGAAANQVTVYDLDQNGGIVHNSTLTVGTNPFGITYYERFN